jgi:glycerol-3-phosphate cytidylyltransferase
MKKGIIAGNFDVIHPGYIQMFKQSKDYCGWLVVALQTDPTVERPEKIKPILSWEERRDMLLSLRYVDEVVEYTTEAELRELLKNGDYSVRILGDDYRDKYATGQEHSSEVVYITRDHGWSTTRFKKLIAESIKN